MDEIANSSGFGKATLYYYFKSKEDVLSAILVDGWQNIWESLEPIIAEDHSPRKTFVSVLMKISENAQKRPGLFKYVQCTIKNSILAHSSFFKLSIGYWHYKINLRIMIRNLKLHFAPRKTIKQIL